MSLNKTILFSPLNWGLGHATRVVPLINNEIEAGNKVIIGTNGAALNFLKTEFPSLPAFCLKGYTMRYWSRPFFILGLILQVPLFWLSIIFEKIQIKAKVKQYGITHIIADNRYGVHCKTTHNSIITHQLFIKAPSGFKWTEKNLHKQTRKFIEKFNVCLVPDYCEINKSLAGELSHGNSLPKNIEYIGPLSRFNNIIHESNELKNNDPADVFIIISGPEPERSRFEKQMEQRFANSNKKIVMVCGQPKEKYRIETTNIIKLPHMSGPQFLFYLKTSKQLITRSGYSTLMDLHAINRTAELIPTPGQPEQEYLAKWLGKQ